MSSLAEAITHHPFSNGTELESWMGAWCYHCEFEDDCDLLLHAILPGETTWPEAWLPEPTGEHHLPSKMVCLAFRPGPDGDPGAEDRAERITEITEYWKDNA